MVIYVVSDIFVYNDSAINDLIYKGCKLGRENVSQHSSPFISGP